MLAISQRPLDQERFVSGRVYRRKPRCEVGDTTEARMPGFISTHFDLEFNLETFHRQLY